MKIISLVSVISLFLGLPLSSLAAPPSNPPGTYTVICDSNSPKHCLQPNADGSITISGGGASQTGINVSVIPTIQNASYVSGNCMGGFQTVAMGTGVSVLNGLTLASKGGLVTAKQVYLFSASPAASTCIDKSTFTIAAADVSKVITTFSITPAAPTGTTTTFATQGALGLGIPSGGTFYAAIVETTTETPGSTSDLVLNFTAF